MLIVGRRVIPWILHYVAHTGSRELFRLAVLAIALGVAFGAAKLFGVSFALGAFFAGMILSESELSPARGRGIAAAARRLRGAVLRLGRHAVRPGQPGREPLPLLATLFIIVIGKSVAAFLIVVAFRYPIATALTISASLAQIGEFSFILAGLGVGLGLLPEQGRDLILAGAILSILLNPVLFAAADYLKGRAEKHPAETAPPAPAHGQRPGHGAGIACGRNFGRGGFRQGRRPGRNAAQRPYDPGRLRAGRQPRRQGAARRWPAVSRHRGR